MIEENFLKTLNDLKIISDKIQEEEIQENNSLPYYKIEDYLKEMLELLSVNGCSKDFDEYIKKECLDYINESIKMIHTPIPDHILKIEEVKDTYMKTTFRQLKHTSTQCIWYFKTAYEHFCSIK